MLAFVSDDQPQHNRRPLLARLLVGPSVDAAGALTTEPQLFQQRDIGADAGMRVSVAARPPQRRLPGQK